MIISKKIKKNNINIKTSLIYKKKPKLNKNTLIKTKNLKSNKIMSNLSRIKTKNPYQKKTTKLIKC